MIKRIKRLYDLSKKDPEAITKLMDLKPEEIARIPDSGDGNAVFFGEGSQDEWKEEVKERKGLKGIFGL